MPGLGIEFLMSSSSSVVRGKIIITELEILEHAARAHVCVCMCVFVFEYLSSLSRLPVAHLIIMAYV